MLRNSPRTHPFVALVWALSLAACATEPTAAGTADAGAADDALALDSVALDSAIFGDDGPCSECAKDNDCGPGLTCDKPAFVCKTPKQVKAGLPVCAADCEESKGCSGDGLCGLSAGACAALSFGDCVSSAVCKVSGRCSASAGACVVGADADCQKSEACSKDGKCKATAGVCTKPATATTCGDGTCEPGETKQSCAKDCGDVGGDPCPCEAGACGVKTGCPNDCGVCGDGQACFDNQCKVAQCQLPDTFTGSVQRITKFELLTSKFGCDFDDSGTPDNGLGKLFKVYSFANEGATNAIMAGKLNLLLHAASFDAKGQAFDVSLLQGDLPPGPVACDFTATDVAQSCSFIARAEGYDGAAKSAICPAKSTFSGVKVAAGQLVTQGTDNTVEVLVYVVGVPLKLKVIKALVQGKISAGSTWGATTEGRICGAIRTTDVDAAVDSISDSALLGTGFDKASVKKLVADLFKPDVDTDGDKKPDAISAAWSSETLPVKVSGIK